MRKYTVQSESQAVLTDPNREREKVDAVCDSIVNNVPYSSKFVNNELALKKKKKKIKRGKQKQTQKLTLSDLNFYCQVKEIYYCI